MHSGNLVIASGDFNGDRIADLLVAHEPAALHHYWRRPDPRLPAFKTTTWKDQDGQPGAHVHVDGLSLSTFLVDSAVARGVLASWEVEVSKFRKVMPGDYKRVLEAREEAREEGLDEDQTNSRIMEVLHG